jgi:hypothetical protein
VYYFDSSEKGYTLLNPELFEQIRKGDLKI